MLAVIAGALFALFDANAQSTNQTPMAARRALETRIDPVQTLKQSLSLSDEQAEKLAPVFKEQQKEITALRTNTSLSRHQRMVRMQEIRASTDAKVNQLLTPEQAAKWKTRSAPRQFLLSGSATGTNGFASPVQFPEASAGSTLQTQRQSGAQWPPAATTNRSLYRSRPAPRSIATNLPISLTKRPDASLGTNAADIAE